GDDLTPFSRVRLLICGLSHITTNPSPDYRKPLPVLFAYPPGTHLPDPASNTTSAILELNQPEGFLLATLAAHHCGSPLRTGTHVQFYGLATIGPRPSTTGKGQPSVYHHPASGVLIE